MCSTDAPLKSGAKATFSIRPEALELYGDDGFPPDLNCIVGEIIASAYQGASVEYELAAIGRRIKARVISPKGKRLYQRGERVTATFRPEDVVLVP